MRSVSMQDPATFLGFDFEQNQYKTQVDERQWKAAKRALEGKPSGTKLTAYIQGEQIPYENDISLSCTFVIFGCVVYQLSQDRLQRYVEGNQGATATDAEWLFAKEQLKGKPSGTKLHSHHKKFRMIQDPEIGNAFLLSHSFIIIDRKILALSSRGWSISGGTAKVKIAVEENGTLWAVKLLHKWSLSFEKTMDLVQNEMKFADVVQLLGGFVGKKIAEIPLQKSQPVFLFPFFEIDLYDFLYKTAAKIADLNGDEFQEAVRTFEYQLLMIVFRITLNLNGIHTINHIIHADIKLDNILLRFDPAVQSITDAKVVDFGFALQMDASGSKIESRGSRCADYLPAEVHKDFAVYSALTDIFSLGFLIKKIDDQLKIFKTDYCERQFFHTIAQQMMVIEPERRLSLDAVSMMLVDYLNAHFVEANRDVLLRQFNASHFAFNRNNHFYASLWRKNGLVQESVRPPQLI